MSTEDTEAATTFRESQDPLPEAPLYESAFKDDPYPYFRDWSVRPPFWATVQSRPCVIAARHADVKEVYGRPADFSSVKPVGTQMDNVDYMNGTIDMAFSDDPDHSRLRSVLQPVFSPGAVKKLTPAVNDVVSELLDEISGGSGRFEAMTQLARPLSSRVLLGHVLNTPREDFGVFEHLAGSMHLLAEVSPDGARPAAYIEAWEAARDYCLAAVDRHGSYSPDDALGRLVQAHTEGSITDDELFGLMFTVYLGGLSTTATLIGNALTELCSRPDQWRLLCTKPDLAPQAVEETLRFNGSGIFTYRFAARDLEWGGLTIPAGATVYTVHLASGFDPSVYDEPFRFDIRRDPKTRHLSMGFGVHACLGAPVARLVTRLVLVACAERFPELRLAPGARPVTYSGMQQERAPEAVYLATS